METCRCSGEEGRRDAAGRDTHLSTRPQDKHTFHLFLLGSVFSYKNTRGKKYRTEVNKRGLELNFWGQPASCFLPVMTRDPVFTLTGQKKGEPGAFKNAEHSKIQETSWKCRIDPVDLLF